MRIYLLSIRLSSSTVAVLPVKTDFPSIYRAGVIITPRSMISWMLSTLMISASVPDSSTAFCTFFSSLFFFFNDLAITEIYTI